MYLASHPYLPKYKIRASVVLIDGEVFDGHVFVTGGQRISDMLRVGNAFLAFETLNGAFHLFNRKSVLRVIPRESDGAELGGREGLTLPGPSGSYRDGTPAIDAVERDAVAQGFQSRTEGAFGTTGEPLAASDASLFPGAPGRRVFRLDRLPAASLLDAWRHLAGLHSKRRLRSASAQANAGRYTVAALLLLTGLGIALAAAPLLIAEPSPERRLADYGQAMRAYSRGDYAAAATMFEGLAERGVVEAQFRLGVMFGQGEGVPRDHSEAMTWHRRAAENGHARAQAAVGAMYRNGTGVRQDYKLAYMWFGLAAAGGDAGAVSQREEVARRMSYDDVAESERRIQDWQSRNNGSR